MPFYELTLQVSKQQAESIDQTLTESGAVGVTYIDAKDAPIYEPKPGETPLWDHIKLIGLFDDESLMTTASESLLLAYPQLEQLKTQLKDQIWERVWMDHFKPMLFGQNSWVIPDGFDIVNPNAVNLILDPGLAFGTGTHETTSLCLKWLDQNDVKGKDLVDFGCGSGILAVMALLHGANKVTCVDIDDQAIQATLQNAKKNGVEQGIEIINPENVHLIKNKDGILANILAEPLMMFCEDFYQMLNDDGFIVLSGILKSQKSMICDKYAQHFVDIEAEIEHDWVRVGAVKGSVSEKTDNQS